MGIDLRDVDQPIGTLSGGERQCVAISRAVHFGAKVLILDEPTAALGVKQSGVVLKYIIQARERGLGVIFITHNPHHAYPVGDRFLLLNRGRSLGYFEKNQITRDELTGLMAGGAELEQLSPRAGRRRRRRRRDRPPPGARTSPNSASPTSRPPAPAPTPPHYRDQAGRIISPMSTTGPEARGHARLRLGTCPDSWGVWFADDPLQTPWPRFLDEVAEVGYQWLELGPYGYLPTDPARLTEELARRGLRVAGGTVHGFSGLHRPGDWPDIVRITRQVSELTAAVGGRHVVFVPVPGYRDDKTGAFLEPAELDDEQWRTMIRATSELGKMIRRGVRPAAGIPPARGQPRGDAGADGAVPRPDQIRRTSRSAWTPATWRTGTRTTWPSSAATPAASATCTSSRWTRPSSRRPTVRASPSGRRWPWAPAASRPAGSPSWRRWPRPCSTSTGTCSWSSSRTCTQPTSTSRSRSPSAPTTTCAASASGRS